MSRYIKLGFICLGFLVASNVWAIDLSGFPPCSSPACSSVAVNAPWPELTSDNVRHVEFHGFHVSLPNGAIETRSNDHSRLYDFDDKRWISFSVFLRSDTDEFFKASRYSMADWADIVYTQTPESPVPDTEAEAYAWYSCLMSKVVFVGQNLVTRYSKSPYTVYSVNDSRSSDKALMIVSSELPDTLFKMEVYGFSEKAVLALIAGLIP
ncbi:MAG TPA: hypothetical protein ENJ28_11405 [Gammaproteobacteria bacterium]|nr:hypothetical protein [Gammaproteobacteria bacterium]